MDTVVVIKIDHHFFSFPPWYDVFCLMFTVIFPQLCQTQPNGGRNGIIVSLTESGETFHIFTAVFSQFFGYPIDRSTFLKITIIKVHASTSNVLPLTWIMCVKTNFYFISWGF